MSKIVECINLSKYYGSFKALDDVNLQIESGRIVGLLGPNGSGKTTLIKILNGLLTPSSGSVLIDGEKPGEKTKSIVSYLPDTNFLNSWMTVEQIVDLFKDFYSDFDEEKAYSMLSKLRVNKDAKLKNLSKGNKEKVCLILIMSRKAKLYILDEPIAAVDPATRDFILSTILNNYHDDSTIIISTHLIHDIESVLDDVLFLEDGRISLQRTKQEIVDRGKTVDELFREVFKW